MSFQTTRDLKIHSFLFEEEMPFGKKLKRTTFQNSFKSYVWH